ncbi:bifunctional diaminohydroxyphosphoribosylaminopyrimidine deaminase/5-amino-6-(5-phosphoribosylamino)uracil reductase RibD [bacterium]|nr:bifunctional diaminohydroxyphosphoribosylaminopyrimidine deaminase/5-amino-6-(5-phosphoribosylamino)uracil reductase RibD [bacterium]
MKQNSDIKYMRQTLRLALKGRGGVSPNPRVGAVIVDKNGRILGKGYHSQYGQPHAEAEAIADSGGSDLRGSTLYVNLEPCCHQGKTPPCTKAVIKAGISRVVIAISDPNPKVNLCGISELKNAGIESTIGVLAEEARYLNRGYLSVRERRRAWCAAKVALSIDGKMANPEGLSKWITGAEARKYAHALRADHDGVMIGSGTLKNDNPELSVRDAKGPNPVRIIIAPHFGIPANYKISKTADEMRTILVTSDDFKGVVADGIEIFRMQTDNGGKINPLELLQRLPEVGVQSVLIEGGSGVLSSFMQADLIDEIVAGYAPSVIGNGISPFEGFKPVSWENRPKFTVKKVKRFGEDVVITYRRKD